MKHFWLAPKDQRRNHWIFHEESVSGKVVLRELYGPLQCNRCRKIDEMQAFRLGLSPEIKIRSKSDYLLSDDGVVCVSAAARQVLEALAEDRLEFAPLPGDYFAIVPIRFIPTDLATAQLELHRPCTACGRNRETCGTPAAASMALPETGTLFGCPASRLENVRGRVFWFLASQDVVSVLRAHKLTGFELIPID